MYNRYINGGEFDDLFSDKEDKSQPTPENTPPPAQPEGDFEQVTDEQEAQPDADSEKKGSVLKNLLGGNIKMPDLDTDTILLLVLVYFLIADNDGGGNMTDTLLIVGVLLLLGF